MGNQQEKSQCYMDIKVGEGPIGRLVFSLNSEECPKTCKNFRVLCKTKYSGTNFHRCVTGFIAQGGDHEKGDGSGGASIYGKFFKDENLNGKHSKRGILSMANKGQNTNGSQFFITFRETPELDGLHVVFGEVVEGLEVLDRIEKVSTEGGDPKENIQIIQSGIIDQKY